MTTPSDSEPDPEPDSEPGAHEDPRYHREPLDAYLRASLGAGAGLAEAEAAGVRVQRFKRAPLARCERALGILRGLWPADLLDVGSGRGAFLWPLLEAFPELRVTSLERSPLRAEQLTRVARGGLSRLRVVQGDVACAPLRAGAVEGALALEVLEHLPDPARAARELVRVARRFVLVSVPSKPDDNPEHIQLFSPADLEALFLGAGARRVQIHHVLNHRIALASL